MIIHRFMSRSEYEQLVAGKELYNNTNHHKKDQKRTNSVGFCFFMEDPDQAVHWLSGIVDLDMCVTMEVPDDWGVRSWDHPQERDRSRCRLPKREHRTERWGQVLPPKV